MSCFGSIAFLADRLHYECLFTLLPSQLFIVTTSQSASVDKLSSWIEYCVALACPLASVSAHLLLPPVRKAKRSFPTCINIFVLPCPPHQNRSLQCSAQRQSISRQHSRNGLAGASLTQETLFWFSHFGYLKTSSPALQVQHKANMTNQTSESQTGRSRRYTVSRLLELAPQNRIINFDLSKFSYDAARGEFKMTVNTATGRGWD